MIKAEFKALARALVKFDYHELGETIIKELLLILIK